MREGTFLSVSVHLSVHVYLFLCVPVQLFIHSSICPLSIHACLSVSVLCGVCPHSSVHPFVHLSVCPSLCVCVPWGSDLDLEAWQQVALPTEPSCQPSALLFLKFAFIYVCSALPACLCAQVCASLGGQTEEGIRFPGIGAMIIRSQQVGAGN